MTLYIDSTDFDRVTYLIFVAGKLNGKSYKLDPHKSFEILQKLEEFLMSANYKIQTINSIIVNTGPGSYTGTRIGVTHAQAIAFALNIPVKFLNSESFNSQIHK